MNQQAQANPIELRVYLGYSLPVDVRKVFTIPDLEISYSLASTLVTFQANGQVGSYLASRWEVLNPQTIEFTLGDKARWSSGERIFAKEVTESFDRAKSEYGKDLVSLFDSVEKIEATGGNKVRFRIKKNTSIEELLKKLCEPMYGVVKHSDQSYNAGVSSGPFLLSHSTEKSIVLHRNPFWFNFNEDIPKSVEIRQQKKQLSERTLLDDSWPNLVTVSSLHTAQTESQLARLKSWKRNLDRVFFIGYGGRGSVDDFRNTISFIKQNLSTDKILAGFVGFALTDQLYPKGMPLHFRIEAIKKSKPVAPQKSLKILYSTARTSQELLSSFKKQFEGILPKMVSFEPSDTGSLISDLNSKSYDLYLGSVGVDSINFDGAMSYYIDLKPPTIPSAELDPTFDFKRRLAMARGLSAEARVDAFKEILKDSITGDFILPMFHYSTLAYSRPEIDLSSVPISDEVVSFSKVKVLRGSTK